jgi:hypothetical protein
VLRYVSWIKTLWTWRVLFRDRLRQVQAAAELVADELESNARRIRVPRYTTGVSLPPLGLRFDAWRQHASTLHVLSKPHPLLWDELRAAYAEMEGAERDLPAPERFEELAARLRATMRAVRT